jgi:catechol 2,3-dioxygenase-like lactoylglutathione lyase family enzyme
MDPKIDSITIGAHDVARACEFYESGFGFPVKSRGDDCVSLALGNGAGELELCAWDALADDAGVPAESSGFRGFTLSYIVDRPSDVDDMLVRLEHAGGVVSKAPRLAFWGYSAHVTDPDGHLWKIASPKRRSLFAGRRTRSGIPEPVAARELALTIGVADMKRAKQFYAEGLGNATKKDYSKFVSFEGDGAPDLAMYKWDALADDAAVAAAGSGFRGFRLTHVVDSAEGVETLVEKAKRAGGEVVRRTADGRERLSAAYFSDPDGYLWKVVARA